jgi:hypothetical protein
VSLNQLGIMLYPQTWITDRAGFVLRSFSGENLNWRLWKSFVEDAPKKPWDGKTLAPAESLGWANGEYAGRLLGGDEGAADRSRRIRIRVEPGGPDGQAKIAAQWLPPGAPPGNLRAVVATADSITLAGDFSNGNSLRAVATREALGGVFQFGKRTTLDRIEMKKAAA